MLAPRLIALATATGSLTATQIRLIGGMLDAIDRLDARRTALERACAILDGGQGLSRWCLAQRLADALERFQSVALRRVKAGTRLPTALERDLQTIFETGAQSANRLWEELRDLPERR